MRFSSLTLLSAVGLLHANDNPFGYSTDTTITKKGEYQLQQSITMRCGLDQGASFDGNYRGYDLSTQFEIGLSDTEHLDLLMSDSGFHSAGVHGVRFGGVDVEYKHLLNSDEGDHGGAAWVAALAYSQLDSSSGTLNTETTVATRLFLQRNFGTARRWYYLTNISASLAHDPGVTKGLVEWSQGLAYRANVHWALGVETVADGVWMGFRRFDNSALRLGPSIAYKTDSLAISLTCLWQMSGAPATNGGRDLRDTCRSETRMLMSWEF